eukprot:scaffold421341_cov57-Attheya_sp.AAC.1
MDRDNERYSIKSYWLEGTQLIQSRLPGIGNAGFRRYGMPDSYMSDNSLFYLPARIAHNLEERGSRLILVLLLPTVLLVY